MPSEGRPHPATVGVERSPHPATVVQRRASPLDVPRALPPHPATVAQPRARPARPPHAATAPRALPASSPAAQRAAALAVITRDMVRAVYAEKKFAGNKLAAKAKAQSIGRDLKRTDAQSIETIKAFVMELDGTSKASAAKAAAAKARPAHDAAKALAAKYGKDVKAADHPAFCGLYHAPSGTVKQSMSSNLTEDDAHAAFVLFMAANVVNREGRSKFACAEPAAFNDLLLTRAAAGQVIATAADVRGILDKTVFYTVNKNGSHKEPCKNCDQWVKQEPN